MRRTVTDQWGAGWKVRTRALRGTGTAPPHPGPDADRMLRRLEAALGRYPAPLVASASTDVWEAAELAEDVAAECGPVAVGDVEVVVGADVDE